MSEQTSNKARHVTLFNGTNHTEDYGTLRMCRTSDCPVDFTSSHRCRHCGGLTSPDAYRVKRSA